jgi:hypothetical protein
MNNDAAALAHVVLEIAQLLDDHVAPSPHTRDANQTIEQIILNLDTNDAISVAQRILRRSGREPK